VVDFEGMCFGPDSILELRYLAQAIELNPEGKEVKLVYKFRTYRGFMWNLTLAAQAGNPYIFDYGFSFTVRDRRFVISDMALGQIANLNSEVNLLQQQLYGAASTISSLPATVQSGIRSASNAIGQIGLNIGRSKI
jgi:hypothetical protein